MFNSIKLGNECHKEKYGNSEGWVPLNMKAWAEEHASQNPSKEQISTIVIEMFKASFEFWDEWTGSRYARIENPYKGMTDFQFGRKFDGRKRPQIVPGTICRKEPNGFWKAL